GSGSAGAAAAVSVSECALNSDSSNGLLVSNATGSGARTPVGGSIGAAAEIGAVGELGTGELTSLGTAGNSGTATLVGSPKNGSCSSRTDVVAAISDGTCRTC